MWKITGMDEGTSIEMVKEGSLLFTITGKPEGVISIAAGCREAGGPTTDNTDWVFVTAPVNILNRTTLKVYCPAHRYITMDKYVAR